MAEDESGCQSQPFNFEVVKELVNILSSHDTIICSGNSIVMHTVGFDQYHWSPSVGLSDPNISDPVATPFINTTYVVSGFSEGHNLISNGDFEQGNIGFTSQYTYNPTNIGANGDYALTDNVIDVHPLGYPCMDHTTGNGLLMAVNGGPIPNTTVWQQSVPVDPQTEYIFSAWVTNWSGLQSNLARLQFSINGQLTGNVFQTLPQQCQWTEFFITWNSGNNTAADIRLINQNLAVIGNDFGLDDIEFKRICEGTDTITIYVEEMIPISDTITLCLGDSVWIGNTYESDPGIYIDTLIGASSCDTISNILLNVLPAYSTSYSFILCEGDSIFLGDNIFTQGGLFTDSLQSIFGCDSLVQIQVDLLPLALTSLSYRICEGDTVLVAGNVYTEPGQYADTLQTVLGCDSLIHIVIEILPRYTVNQEFQLCEGDSIVVGNNIYTQGGFFIDSLLSKSGCDSLVQIQIDLLPIASTLLSYNICQGDTVIVAGNVYTDPGQYVDTLQTPRGCDSLIYFGINIFPRYTLFQLIKLCQGDSVVVGNNVYTQGGVFIDSLQSISGCDSLVQIQIDLLPIASTSLSYSICQGDTVLVAGNEYAEPGQFVDTLQSGLGCDSVIYIGIAINTRYNISDEIQLCDGGSYIVGPHEYFSSGNYIDTLVSVHGCDSIVHTSLDVSSPEITYLEVILCEGDGFDIGGTQYVHTGFYKDTLLSVHGCDSIVHLKLTVQDTVLQFQDVLICPGDTITVGDNVYGLPGLYSDSFQSVSGCDSTVITLIHYEAPKACQELHCKMYVPNVFSPNGDAINDIFFIQSKEVEIHSLSIFDRWGGLLYHIRELNPSWDGLTGSGVTASPGVYVWIVDGVCGNGERFTDKGDVTLIR